MASAGGRQAWFRLHEKGGKRHEVPAHHNAENYLDAYFIFENDQVLFQQLD